MIQLQIENSIALVTICRPERRNALDFDHWSQLQHIFTEVSSTDLDGLIITGSSDIFAAGADIQQLVERKPLDALKGVSQNTMRLLEELPFVSVAAINGHALGGGCEIALACDMRLAVPLAKIGLPEVGLGIIPAGGGTHRLPRVVGYAKALELIITGLPVSGDEALRIGLVNRLVQPENLLDEAQELVTQIGRQGRVAVNLVRQMLRIGNTNAELGMLMERLASATLYSDEDRSYRMNRFLTKNK